MASDLYSAGSDSLSNSDLYWDLFLDSPEFNSSAPLVNGQLVGNLPFGFPQCYVLFEIFVSTSFFHYP